MTPPASMIADRIAVIDTDSHVSEPPDLWSSRLPSKWADSMPRIARLPGRDEEFWWIGDRVVQSAWMLSVAGWKEPLPSHPRVQEEVDPAAYDPVERATRLDEHGVAAQVLYPNILGFHILSLLTVDDPAFRLACVTAYNDFLAEFAAAAPGRFIPIMALPIWDVEASVAEMERAAGLGHRGILFSNALEKAGMPRMRDPHWHPILSAAQDAGLSVNFHIGFGKTRDAGPIAPEARNLPREEARRAILAEVARGSTLSLQSNSEAIVELIVSGMCHQFPTLNFVSVESGFGYVPYLLETLDWQWKAVGAAGVHPERLMPSEYFRRQIYATFWFEHQALVPLVDQWADNVMFETDFPHPTCLAPGPGSYTDSARNVIEANLSGLSEATLQKILHDNAARVYGV